ncbi:hypothetical protein FHG87_002402 [Trinorchestia longiramus]|nr:hypothetical protein FHG87_002402 [Trinorchestia longiramus]
MSYAKMSTVCVLLLSMSVVDSAVSATRSFSASRGHLIRKRDAEAEAKASATAVADPDAAPLPDATAQASANPDAAVFGAHYPHQGPPHPHHAFIPSHGPPLHGGPAHPLPGIHLGHPLPPFDHHVGGPGVATVRSRGLGYDFTYDIGGHHPIHKGTHLTHKHSQRVIHHKVKDDHHYDDHGDEYYEDDDEKYDENHITSGYGLNRVKVHSHGEGSFHGRGLNDVTHTSAIKSRPLSLGSYVSHGGLGHPGIGSIGGHDLLGPGLGHAAGHGIGHEIHGPQGLGHGLGPRVHGHSRFGVPHLGHPGPHGGHHGHHGGHPGFILNSHPGPGFISHHGGGLGHGGLIPHRAGAYFSGHSGHGSPHGGLGGRLPHGVVGHSPHGHAGVPLRLGKQISHAGYYGGGVTHAATNHR